MCHHFCCRNIFQRPQPGAQAVGSFVNQRYPIPKERNVYSSPRCIYVFSHIGAASEHAKAPLLRRQGTKARRICKYCAPAGAGTCD